MKHAIFTCTKVLAKPRSLVCLFALMLLLTRTSPALADTTNEPPELKPPIDASPKASGSLDAHQNSSQSPALIEPQNTVPRTNREAYGVPADYRRLRDTIRQSNGHNPYRRELGIQAQPQSISSGPIQKVSSEPEKTPATPTGSDDIAIAQPPLQALVSINRNLNPFSLEASYSQEVGLRDALRAVSEGNLDVLKSVTNVEAQRWHLKNAYTSYLPDISLGFNEVGLNSKSQIPLEAIAVTQFGGTTISSNARTTETIVDTPLTILNGGFNWKPIQGGRLIFTVMQQKHQLNANRAKLRGDISDTLLSCAKDYYDLVLQSAILEIRTSSYATSLEQLRQNQVLKSGGLATKLDVLQANTQLSKDKQNLILQQKTRRHSAIELSHLLNANLSEDLVPQERVVRKISLIPESATINQLLQTAIDNRPELKQYEELRQVAKKNIAIDASNLLPSVSLGGNIIGIASNIGHMQPTYLLNFGVKWKFDGLGTTAATNMEAARWQARQALLEANQKFSDVFQQVRNSYNDSFTAESALTEASDEVVSAKEALRLAQLRLRTGLGTYLDVLTAQRDYTQAEIDKAQAIINFNVAQVQLVHDVGMASIDNITSNQPIKLNRS